MENSNADAPNVFPTAMWGPTTAEFFPIESEAEWPAPIRAVVVITLWQEEFLLADIAGRGWCTPSGRLEAGETPEQAARRETWEEAGATLGPLTPMGCYKLTNTESGAVSYAPCYVADALMLAPIPDGSESRGVRTATLKELPDLYYAWDALMEAVFKYSVLSAEC